MSLESLEICGIRGFSPIHSCKVDISSPLTIITGPTGSGKTAVLEALQVAVSGTAKSQIPLKINDPKTHARTETVASVRLVFQGADNVKYTAERQFKLKVASPGNTSYNSSTDPPTLTSSATSIHPDISMLPKLLQVSNPVWNSLIFVYQEDALWPLGEPKQVKSHMDKITGLDGHSKVLRTLQSGMGQVRKEKDKTASELKGHEKGFENFIEDKSRFDQEEKRLSEISQQCFRLETDIKDLNTRVEIQKRRDELKASIRVLQESKRGWESEMQRIERRLLSRYLPGQSKERLEQKIDEERSFLRDKRVKACNVEDELRDAPELIAKIWIPVDGLKKKKNHLINQEIEHRHQREHIGRLKNRLKTNFSLAQESGSSNVDHGLPPLDADDEEWTTTLESLYQTSVREEASLSELSTNITQKQEEVFGKKYEWKGGEKELDRIEVKIDELKGRLPNSVQQEQEALQAAKQSALEAKRKWTQAKTKGIQRVASELRQKVKLLEETKWALDFDVVKLEEEEKNATKQEGAVKALEEQLQYAIDGCNESLEELSKRLNESASDLQAKTGLQLSNWPQSFDVISSAKKAEKECKSLFRIKNELSEKRKSILGKAKGQREKHQKQLHDALLQEGNAKTRSQNSLKQLTTTVKEAKRKIPSIRTLLSEEDRAQFEGIFSSLSTPSSTHPFSATYEQVNFIQTILAKTNAEIQKVEEDEWGWKTGLRHVKQEFELFRENFQCPACGVQGSDNAGIEKMTKFFEQRMSEYENPQNLNRVEENLRLLNQAKNSFGVFEGILSKAVSCSSTSKEAKEEHGKAVSQLREREKEMETCTQNVNEIEKLDASSLEEYMVGECSGSVERLKDASDKLMKHRNAQSSKSERRPSCVIRTDLKNQREKLQRKSSELRTEREKLDSCREAELELGRAKSEFDKQKNIWDTLESLQKRRQEAEVYRQNNGQLQDSFRQARENLEKLSADYTETEARVSKFKNMTKDGLEEWRRSVGKLGSFDPKANSQGQERVEKYLKIWEKVLNYQEKKRESLIMLETLEGNLDFCMLEEEIANIDHDIREKQQKCEGEDDVLGVNLQSTLRKVEDERKEKIAEKKIQEKFVEELHRKMDEYKVDQGKLNQCLIKKAVLAYSLEDLKSVYLAREKALQLGHKIKMESINRAIMKLWNSSYRGTNIDEIRIAAYDEKANKGGETPKRYSQYHVEMRQGQSWVKMRGRCSTGQKYFACLIVRLALADVFCKDLSFLVLDQPTANVDHEHAGYIGRAINTFLASRRRRGNFHLLLATTDRELADMLDVRESCDHCYVITEDESGYSRAELRNLEEL